MSTNQIVVRGTLRPDGTLELNEKPNPAPGRAEVRLHPVGESEKSEPGWWEVLQQIRKDQDARGFKRRSREEIDAEIAAERAAEEEYEERWRQIWLQGGNPPPSQGKSS